MRENSARRHPRPYLYVVPDSTAGGFTLNVPTPAGATKVNDWYDPDGRFGEPAVEAGPDVRRYFSGSSRVVEWTDGGRDIEVVIDGEQMADGRVHRFVTVNDDSITSAQARQFAALLIEAADEADAMSTYDGAIWQ